MFQSTVERADALSGEARRVVVAASGHRGEVEQQLAGSFRGHVLYQPANRGTAPGIFLPLSRVLTLDPEATVVVQPSDHFIHPEGAFLETVQGAASALSTLSDMVILLGARPQGPEPDYGWILPARAVIAAGDNRVHPVDSFVEKPTSAQARTVMAAGGRWNTFILVAKAKTLWYLGRRCFPGMIAEMERLAPALGTPWESEALAQVYERMPSLDFSRDLLQISTDRLATVELRGVTWSDWGRPERIIETLERIGETPAFPRETLSVA